jgi:hypothetical protein
MHRQRWKSWKPGIPGWPVGTRVGEVRDPPVQLTRSRVERDHPRSATPTHVLEDAVTTPTLAQQYAQQYAQGIVPKMLGAIDKVHRNTTWIARCALAVTTPHQVLFLGSLGHGSMVDIITAWIFAALIPAVTDLGMLTMLRITQTAGMRRQARRRALLVLTILVIESATVNALAPGAAVFRVLVAFAAVVLALVEWVASAVGPDFAALDAAETKASTEVAGPVKDPKRSAAAKAAAETRRARAAAKAAADADRRERRRLARQERELEKMAAGYLPANAPVSPAA